MEAERTVVVNSSPLILLFKSELSDILPKLFGEVLVPEAVWDEIIAGGSSDAAARQLQLTSWARRTAPVTTNNQIITSWNLGAGESEVLNLALVLPGSRAMVDDAAARACARTLGIRTLGTGGALVLAKRRGFIPSVAVALQSLRDAGLWLSDDIARLLLTQAGE